MTRISMMAILAVVGLATPAAAHVIAGDRVFPVTTTFDDPGVGDELTLPQVVYQRSGGPTYDTQLQWEFDKRITETTAVIYNQGFDFLNSSGNKGRSGLENVYLTGKWQAYTNAAHEFVASVGLIREFSGTRKPNRSAAMRSAPPPLRCISAKAWAICRSAMPGRSR